MKIKSQMKKLVILFILLSSISVFAGGSPDRKANGLFLAVGVGPRFPVGAFSNTSKLGYGFDVELSYTDNELLPVFIFLKSGFESYPGSQDFYRTSNYSNFSTNVFPVKLGVRYFLAPLLESQALLMPILELSGSYGLFHTLNEFKTGTGITDYTDEQSKFGFTASAGFSAFMLELLASYNYFSSNQFFSLDLKVRFPIFLQY